MSHPFPGALLTRLQSGTHKQANLIKFTLRDGTVLAMTDWDQDLSVDLDGLGAITYSKSMVQGLKAFAAQINAAIDDGEVSILITDQIEDNPPPAESVATYHILGF